MISRLSIWIQFLLLISCTEEASFEYIEEGMHIRINGQSWEPPLHSITTGMVTASDVRVFSPADSTWLGRELFISFPSNADFWNGNPKSYDFVFGLFIPEGKLLEENQYKKQVHGRIEFWETDDENVAGRFEMAIQREKDNDQLDITGNFKIPR